MSMSLTLSRGPGAPSNILVIAARELRESVRSRWFLLYSIAFAALGLGVSFISGSGSQSLGLSGYGRTAAGLVNLVLLVVPLMGLTAGAASIAGDRERGMLSYLLAQPVSRAEVLIGKFVGLGGALIACLCLGLGACAAVMAWKGGASNSLSLAWLAAFSMLLALSMLSLGMLVSALARKSTVAIGTAIFLWLALVFVSDLGIMAGTLAFKLRIQELFALSMLNPLQVFKMWSLHAVNGELDVLGPAGLYAADTFGNRLHAMFAGCMTAWVILPLGAAGVAFARRSPV